MGLEALLGPLAMKLGAGIAVVAGLLLAYLGIKRKGVREERQRQAVAQAEAQREVDDRLRGAREGDAAVDARTRQEVDEARRQGVPPTGPQPKTGDKFHFAWPIVLALLLGGCVAVPRVVVPNVDVPSRPILSACPQAPHAEAIVTDGGVLLSLADAERIRVYLYTAQACQREHEAVLWGHVEKLEARLRALSGPRGRD